MSLVAICFCEKWDSIVRLCKSWLQLSSIYNIYILNMTAVLAKEQLFFIGSIFGLIRSSSSSTRCEISRLICAVFHFNGILPTTSNLKKRQNSRQKCGRFMDDEWLLHVRYALHSQWLNTTKKLFDKHN